MRHILFLGIVFSFISQAQADILFLNLNNAPGEIAAAQRSAALRKEKLIIVPSPNAAISGKLERLSRQANGLYDRAFRPETPAPLRDQLRTQANRIHEEMAKYRIGKEDLINLMREAGKGRNFSSLIISGHDGNGHLSGDLARFTDADMSDALEALGPAAQGIQALYLWGCYTTTPGSISGHWKKALPNARLLVGFEGKGPLKDNPMSHTILEDSLKLESQMLHAKNSKALQDLTKKIRNFNNRDTAICRDDDYVSKKRGTASMDALMKKCGDFEEHPLHKQYLCYFNGDPGCENPPADTGAGVLRQFYTYAQDIEHCRQVWSTQGKRVDLPSRDTILSLLFFNNIKKSFSLAHAKELAELDRVSRELGAPDSLLIGNPGFLSRAELRRRVHELRLFLEERMKQDDLGVSPVTYLLPQAREVLGRVNDTLLHLSRHCVPSLNWVEGQPVPSECMQNAWREPQPEHFVSVPQTVVFEKTDDLRSQNHLAFNEKWKIEHKQSILQTQLEEAEKAPLRDEEYLGQLYIQLKSAELERKVLEQKVIETRDQLNAKAQEVLKAELERRREEQPGFKGSPLEKAYNQVLNRYIAAEAEAKAKAEEKRRQQRADGECESSGNCH